MTYVLGSIPERLDDVELKADLLHFRQERLARDIRRLKEKIARFPTI